MVKAKKNKKIVYSVASPPTLYIRLIIKKHKSRNKKTLTLELNILKFPNIPKVIKFIFKSLLIKNI